MKHIKIIIIRYLHAKTCDSCYTFKHVLWASNTQVPLDGTLHTNKHNIYILHIIHIQLTSISK